MKKFFTIIMSVLMIACFMPTMAFASGGGGATDTAIKYGEGDSAITVGNTNCNEDNCEHIVAVKIGEKTVHYSSLMVAMYEACGLVSTKTSEGRATFTDSEKQGKTSEIKLLKDIDTTKANFGGSRSDKFTAANIVYDGWNVTLDMNNHDLTLAEGNALKVVNGTLEIKGNGTIKESSPWKAPILVYGATENNESYGTTPYSKLIVGQNVTLEGYCGIQVNTDDKSYEGYGVDITVKGTLIGHADADDSTDLGAGIEVKGELDQTTGNVPKITLDGATIQADGTGIYAGGYANWTIKNTVISGNTPTAMCIKSGKFDIQGGEFYSASVSQEVEKQLKERYGSIDTGAAINIINQEGYAGAIDVTISAYKANSNDDSAGTPGKFVSADGYAIYQCTDSDETSDVKLTIEDGDFKGAKGALYLANFTNKGVVEKGIFSSDPTEYMVSGKALTALNGVYYVSKTDDEIRTDSNTSAFKQGIKLAPLTGEELDDGNSITGYSGQKVSITVAPQLHEENNKEGKWIGIAVPVPKTEKEKSTMLSYELSNGVKSSGKSISETSISSDNDVIVKKVTIDSQEYVGFYWDYDDVVVSWIKYKFSEDTSINQYNQVFVDVTAVPAKIDTVIGHEVGKDACVYNVEYKNGVATVNYCGLNEGAQAIVKIPVEYQPDSEENTYLYYKYDGAKDWTMMGKGVLNKDGNYYEYCYIDLKDGNAVNLQYKYGPVVDDSTETVWISPVQAGVYTLKVVANEVDGQTAKDAEHSWNSGKITKEATEQEDGSILYTCTRCSATKTETITKHTHKLEKVSGKAATTSEDGWKDYWKCTNSGCSMHWSDKDGRNVIEDLDAWKVGEGKIAKKTSSGGGGGYVAPSTDTTTGAATTTVKPTTTTAADGTKTTTAAVSEAEGTKLVDKAVSNKSTEIIVNAATGTAVKEATAGTATEVAIPAATISQIVEKTDAAVTIKSDVANVTLDKTAVKAVAAAAGTTGTVKLIVKAVAQDESKVQIELKIETANGTVSDFKGGNVSVTVKLSAALAAKDVVCVYIDDNGVYHKVTGTKNADGTFTFTTQHFSSYAVMEAAKADKVIAEQATKAKDLAKALKLKASSTKTAKGSIKVTLSLTKGDVKAIEDLGYTVKYKFYRSTKKSASYKAALEKTGKAYTNTSGKKGTRYYYKARVMVYDAKGTLVAKTALSQCKYACRVK